MLFSNKILLQDSNSKVYVLAAINSESSNGLYFYPETEEPTSDTLKQYKIIQNNDDLECYAVTATQITTNNITINNGGYIKFLNKPIIDISTSTADNCEIICKDESTLYNKIGSNHINTVIVNSEQCEYECYTNINKLYYQNDGQTINEITSYKAMEDADYFDNTYGLKWKYDNNIISLGTKGNNSVVQVVHGQNNSFTWYAAYGISGDTATMNATSNPYEYLLPLNDIQSVKFTGDNIDYIEYDGTQYPPNSNIYSSSNSPTFKIYFKSNSITNIYSNTILKLMNTNNIIESDKDITINKYEKIIFGKQYEVTFQKSPGDNVWDAMNKTNQCETNSLYVCNDIVWRDNYYSVLINYNYYEDDDLKCSGNAMVNNQSVLSLSWPQYDTRVAREFKVVLRNVNNKLGIHIRPTEDIYSTGKLKCVLHVVKNLVGVSSTDGYFVTNDKPYLI